LKYNLILTIAHVADISPKRRHASVAHCKTHEHSSRQFKGFWHHFREIKRKRNGERTSIEEKQACKVHACWVVSARQEKWPLQ
jgi:hypothetical protein